MLFVDRLEGDGPPADGVAWLAAVVLGEAGLEDCWSIDLGGGSHAGAGRRAAR